MAGEADELWQQAQKRLDRQDADTAHALGFDRCQACGEWFHLGSEEWVDCVRCGRHCPECAGQVAWEWCDVCGFHYCEACYGSPESFICDVCSI